jgi:hypothetical protein
MLLRMVYREMSEIQYQPSGFSSHSCIHSLPMALSAGLTAQMMGKTETAYEEGCPVYYL